MLEPFSTAQIKIIYNPLATPGDVPGGFMCLATYRGKVNTVDPDATASFQRNAILTTSCVAGWVNPEEETKYFLWVRKFYEELYVETGGVPVPGEQLGGCIIAHPDNDLIDRGLNTSGVPWHTLYYHDHYPRLQKIKSKWDPLNIFKHALSVKPF